MSGTTASMPASLTDPAVVAFATEFGLTDPPVILTYQNEGYGPDWCHVSAKAQAIKHGGRRVHGWALWQYPNGLMGEFHSVWEDANGTLIDVTPPKFGGRQVMFVRDKVTDIYEINGLFAQPNNRMPPPHAPFWWDGHQIDDAVWGFDPTANMAFVAYCAKLGFAANDYPTEPLYG
jgi:hypothetical protein